jgi:hypothetical protein
MSPRCLAASTPIPVAAFKLSYIYSTLSRFLSVYSSAFCFILAFAFYNRH